MIASLNISVAGKRSSRRLFTHPSVSAPLMPKRYPERCHPCETRSVGLRFSNEMFLITKERILPSFGRAKSSDASR